MAIRIEGSAVIDIFNHALDSSEFQEWAAEFKLKQQNTEDEIAEFTDAVDKVPLGTLQREAVEAHKPFNHLTTYPRIALQMHGQNGPSEVKRVQDSTLSAMRNISAALPESPIVNRWGDATSRVTRALAASTLHEPTELAVSFLTSPYGEHGPLSIAQLSGLLYPQTDLKYARSLTNVQIMKLRQTLQPGVNLVNEKNILRWQKT